MDKLEVSKLLTLASLVDNRTVIRETVEMWWPMVEHITLDDATQAIRMHFAESEKYLMPVHVVANVRRIREARNAQRQLADEDWRMRPGFVPSPKPANLDAMARAWADPEQFAIEEVTYRKQVADHFRAKKAA